jgi:hypothetical protein
MHSVLALVKGWRVGLDEAWHVLSSKSYSIKHVIRTYIQ